MIKVSLLAMSIFLTNKQQAYLHWLFTSHIFLFKTLNVDHVTLSITDICCLKC